MPRKGLRLVAPTAAALLGRHWREQPRAAALRGNPWPGPPVPVALRGSPWHRELEAVALLGSTRYAVTRAPEHFSGPGGAPAYIRPMRRPAALRGSFGVVLRKRVCRGLEVPKRGAAALPPGAAIPQQRGFRSATPKEQRRGLFAYIRLTRR